MLHVRLIVPAGESDEVLDLLDGDPTVTGLVVVAGASRRPAGDLVLFDVARESASRILERLRDLGLEKSGSITLDEAEVVLSDAARRAEATAPGRPQDAVIWDEIEEQATGDSAMSWSFAAFLILATLIAGIGRYLDQPILIVGAMVVGPEFAAVSAVCFGLARGNVRLAALAARTLVLGFAVAIAVAVAWWSVANLAGWIASGPASSGRQTDFIIDPDVWSFVIALLAGVAGVLSLTAAKSSTLVGVFISVVTVPAAGTLGLTVATGLWDEAWHALLQLLLNLGGMVLSGTITLLVQRVVWSQVRRTRGTSVTDSRR
jgi:uncharacterized hydrophobic protein (TIGR00271 family)